MSGKNHVNTHRCPDLVDRLLDLPGPYHSTVHDGDHNKIGEGYSNRSASEARERALDKAAGDDED